MKYRVLGKEKVLALGAYDAVSLADARELRDAARKQLAKGNDPMVLRKADKVANWVASKNSFESVTRLWWAHWRPSRSEQHAGQVMRQFEANVFPYIGAQPVNSTQIAHGLNLQTRCAVERIFWASMSDTHEIHHAADDANVIV